MFFKILKSLWNFLKTPWVIGLLITILASLFLWFAGPLIAVSDYILFQSTTARLIGIAFLFFLWGLLLALQNQRKQRKALENPDLLEKVIQEKQGKEALTEANKYIRDKVKYILKTVTTASLYESNNRSRYSLPWFLVLGTKDSGKTSFLLNSGVKFPINKETDRHLYELKVTNNVEAFFSNDAVFIDTPGNFTDSYKGTTPHNLWLYLCKCLFKARPTHAINGIIVCVSMRELLNADTAKSSHLAREIRERLDEAQRKVRTSIPVYLVFTKCDVISGFSQFFNRLSRIEKEQVFGCASKQGNMTIAEVHNELQDLLQNLNSQILQKVHQERVMAARGDIFLFPQELANLSTRIEDFIANTFEPSRYHHPTLFQGFFFTCALDSRDLLASSLQGGELLYQTGFEPTVGENATGFFLLELIKRVILPHKNTVEMTKKDKFRSFFHGYASQLLVGTFFLFGVMLLGISFMNNYSRIDVLDKNYIEFSESYAKTPYIYEPASALPELSEITKLANIYNPSEDSMFKYGLGLYQGDKIEDVVDTAYLALLNARFLPAVKEEVKSTLLLSLADPMILKQNLRIYLMLHDPTKINSEVLLSWLSTQWSNNYKGNAEIQSALLLHMEYLIEHGITPENPDAYVVEEARKALLRIPLQILVYQQLQEEAELGGEPSFTFRAVIGASPLSGDNYPIPYLYTKAGYEEYLIRRLPSLIQSVTSDSWIFGKTPVILSTLDINRLNREVRSLYFRDYAQKWNNAIQAIKVAPAATLSEINTQVNQLSTGISPITLVLRELKTNTNFILDKATESPSATENALAEEASKKAGKQLGSVVGGKAGKALVSAGAQKAQEVKEKLNKETQKDALNIQQAFADLQSLLDAQNNPSIVLKNANTKMMQLGEYLATILASDAPDQRILSVLLEIADEKDTLLRSVESAVNKLPNPIRGWYLAYNSATINRMLAVGAYSIGRAYQENVLKIYNKNLRYFYPVDSKSPQDANIEDFTMFFKAGGVLDNFNITYLRPFLDASGKPRTIMGYALPISQYSLNALEKANNVRRAFFLSSQGLGIHMMIEPYALDETLESVKLTTNGKSIEYWHGPVSGMSLVWPVQDGDTTSELKISALNGIVTQHQTRGDWSLFRIFRNSTIKRKEGNTCLLETRLKDKWVQFLFQFRNKVNPFDPSICSFIVPKNL